MPRKVFSCVSIIVILLGIFIYYKLDPSKVLLFPKCPFYLLTGLKCPGCGSQRAIHQLLHFHLGDAFRYNALMVASMPLLVFLFFADMFKKRWPKLYVFSRSPILSWSILAIVIIWWMFRNIVGW